MNQRLYQTQKFALNYYHKLYKAKHAIDNSSPSKSNIPFSSRNTSHMARYEQQLKTKKLLNKLIQINQGNHRNKQNYSQNLQPEFVDLKKKAKKLISRSKKNNKKIINYSTHAISFNNPPINRQKSLQISSQNINIIERLLDAKSIYGQCFSKERVKSLKKYKKILTKKDNEHKQQNCIRNNIFSVYQQIKLSTQKTMKRPQSSVSHKRRKLTKVQDIQIQNGLRQSINFRPKTAKI